MQVFNLKDHNGDQTTRNKKSMDHRSNRGDKAKEKRKKVYLFVTMN